MNPYATQAAPRRWWKTTTAALLLLVLVAVLSAFNLALGVLAMLAAMVAMWMLPPWRWFAKLGASFAAMILLTLGAALGGQLDDNETNRPDAKAASAAPHEKHSTKAANYSGKSLVTAEARANEDGYGTSHHDASPDDRAILLRSGWKVCFQEVDSAARTMAFGAVKVAEPCPAKDGEALPWPTMPMLVGTTYTKAVEELKSAGLDPTEAVLDTVYLDVDAPTAAEASAHGDEWHVCFQTPDRGADVTSTTTVTLDLGRWAASDSVRECPSKKDATYKDPSNRPDTPREHHEVGEGQGGDTPSHSDEPSGNGSVGAVHPGAFCSPAGAFGTSSTGGAMVCGPASDGRNRWHKP